MSTLQKSEPIRRLMRGSLENLPPKHSNLVRVFLSSTFTDFGHERNLLTTQIFPWLKKYCQERGLEFVSVDMRWGVRDEAQIDHKTTEICLEQIDLSEQVSQGPFFVAFLGDKYGGRPYPSSIEAGEFEILLSAAKASSCDISLLKTWFKKDTNASPAVYVLQPITSQFPYYNDDSDEHAEKRNKDKQNWDAVNELLMNTLRTAANLAHLHNHISSEARHKYYQSVTENEIREGILKRSDASSRTLCFIREFTQPGIDTSDAKAGRFQDLDGGFIDTEATDLLNDLKITSIPSKLCRENIFKFTIPWQPEGVDLDHPDHALYMHDFEKTFLVETERLIAKYQEENASQPQADLDLYNEVLSHSYFCVKKARNFGGCDDTLILIKQRIGTLYEMKDDHPYKLIHTILDHIGMSEDNQLQNDHEQQVAEYLKDHGVGYATQLQVQESISSSQRIFDFIKVDQSSTKKLHKPVVVYGPSGSGKTSMLAKIHHVADKWFPGRQLVIISRFLGTTRHSISLRSAILSTCLQIWENYDVDRPDIHDLEHDFSFLKIYFRYLLMTLDAGNKPLLLIWDSVDQFNEEDYAHSMRWLPTYLSAGVHMIISVIDDAADSCLKNTREVLAEDACYVPLPILSNDAVTKAIALNLQDCGRTLTDEQLTYLLASFKRCAIPLYLKIAIDQAKTWSSFTPMEECVLGISIRSAIEQMFSKLEKDHGQILVCKVLGLLSVSQYGLSFTELEDLCSLDDEVLQDTYLYQLPPSENVIRLPQLVLQRVLRDLGDYITEVQSGDAQVYTWYHKQFREAACRRYANDAVKKPLHEALLDYFDGVWKDKIKPLVLFKKKKARYDHCLRGAPAQPLCYSLTSINKRKLLELPYHLCSVHQFTKFIDTCCVDFKWLYYKIKAFSVTTVVTDLKTALKLLRSAIEEAELQQEGGGTSETDELLVDDLNQLTRQKADVEMVLQMLLLAGHSVTKDVDSLAVQILGQLEPGYMGDTVPDSLLRLRDNTREWIKSCTVPVFVPKSHCLPRPDGCLLTYVDFTLGFPGDDSASEKKLHFLKNSKQLVGVQRQKSGDVVNFYDCTNVLQVRDMMGLPNMSVRWIDFLDDERYMYLEVYTKRDRYQPEFCTLLIDVLKGTMVTPPKGYDLVCFSQTVKYCLLTRKVSEKSVDTSESAEDQNKKPAGELLAYIYEFETKQIKPIHVRDKSLGVLHAVFSPNDSTVVIACDNARHYTFAVESARLRCSFGVPDKRFQQGSFGSRPDNHKPMHFLSENRFLTAGLSYNNEKMLYVYDLHTGERFAELKGHDYKIGIIAVNSCGNLAASASKETVVINGIVTKYIWIWDLTTYTTRTVVKKAGPWNSVTFGGDDLDLLLTNQHSESVIDIWYVGGESESASLLSRLAGHSQQVMFMEALGHDAIISAALDNTVRFWTIKGLTTRVNQDCDQVISNMVNTDIISKTRPYHAHEGTIETTCTAVSSDGETALVGTRDGWLILCDLLRLTHVEYLREKSPIADVICSQSGQYFISCSQTTKVWSTKKMELVHEFHGKEGNGVRSANPSCLAERNNVLVVGYSGMEAYGFVWDLNTGNQLAMLQGLYGFNTVAITSDGKQVVSSLFDFPLIYSVETGECLTSQQPDTMIASSTCLVISPNDRLVAVGSSDGSVRIMDMTKQKYVFKMQHRSSVREAVFTRDSSRLLTAGFKDILVWSATNGSLLHTLSRHGNFIHKLFFSDNDRYLVSAGEDKEIVIWDFKKLHSIASFKAHCPINREISIASDLSSIVFSPQSVAYIGILQPNPTLQKLLAGELNIEVPSSVQSAQGVALTFTPQKVTKKTSSACAIL